MGVKKKPNAIVKSDFLRFQHVAGAAHSLFKKQKWNFVHDDMGHYNILDREGFTQDEANGNSEGTRQMILTRGLQEKRSLERFREGNILKQLSHIPLNLKRGINQHAEDINPFTKNMRRRVNKQWISRYLTSYVHILNCVLQTTAEKSLRTSNLCSFKLL